MGFKPEDLLLPGISGFQNGINMLFQQGQNKKSQQWSEKMYDRQRQDALTDWQMNNAYNSPEQLMQRYKAAGLNPNLIYGNNGPTASTVRPASPGSPSFIAPKIDVMSGVMGYADMAVKQAQTDNLKAATDVAKQDALLKNIQAFATLQQGHKTKADTAISQFDLGQKQRLADLVVKQAELSANKTAIDSQSALDANERANALQAPTIEKMYQEIANLKIQKLNTQATTAKTYAEIKNIEENLKLLKDQGTLNYFEIMLNRQGLTKNDPYYIRIAENLLSSPTEKVKKVLANPQKYIIGGFKDLMEYLGPKD